MNRHQIMTLIKELAQSQGYYGRLYKELHTLKHTDYDEYDAIMDDLESLNFKDSLDFILYVEG
jgi:hypothetical protein